MNDFTLRAKSCGFAIVHNFNTGDLRAECETCELKLVFANYPMRESQQASAILVQQMSAHNCPRRRPLQTIKWLKCYEAGEESKFNYNLKYCQEENEYSFTWREKGEGDMRSMSFVFNRAEAEEFLRKWLKLLVRSQTTNPAR